MKVKEEHSLDNQVVAVNELRPLLVCQHGWRFHGYVYVIVFQAINEVLAYLQSVFNDSRAHQ